METPAILCEIGNSSTVASLAEPPSPCHPGRLSMLYLNGAIGSILFSPAGAPSATAAAAIANDAPVTASNRPLRLTMRIPLRPDIRVRSHDTTGRARSVLAG